MGGGKSIKPESTPSGSFGAGGILKRRLPAKISAMKVSVSKRYFTPSCETVESYLYRTVWFTMPPRRPSLFSAGAITVFAMTFSYLKKRGYSPTSTLSANSLSLSVGNSFSKPGDSKFFVCRRFCP